MMLMLLWASQSIAAVARCTFSSHCVAAEHALAQDHKGLRVVEGDELHVAVRDQRVLAEDHGVDRSCRAQPSPTSTTRTSPARMSRSGGGAAQPAANAATRRTAAFFMSLFHSCGPSAGPLPSRPALGDVLAAQCRGHRRPPGGPTRLVRVQRREAGRGASKFAAQPDLERAAVVLRIVHAGLVAQAVLAGGVFEVVVGQGVSTGSARPGGSPANR
jgi:hypothetical protein